MNKETITTTKEELTKAHKLWNKEYLLNPESFDEINDSDLIAENQTRDLLNYLSKVKS